MKRVSQLTALALLMGLAASTTCAAETMPALTLSHLQQQHGVAIDTRLSAYYNGWPQRANGPEGHEPQALNLSARWLGAMSDDQLRAWAKQHQLQSDTPIALYGSPEDNVSVAARLKQTGFTRLSTLSDALSQTDCKSCRTLNSWSTPSGCTTYSKGKRSPPPRQATGKCLKPPGERRSSIC